MVPSHRDSTKSHPVLTDSLIFVSHFAKRWMRMLCPSLDTECSGWIVHKPLSIALCRAFPPAWFCDYGPWWTIALFSTVSLANMGSSWSIRSFTSPPCKYLPVSAPSMVSQTVFVSDFVVIRSHTPDPAALCHYVCCFGVVVHRPSPPRECVGR